MSLADSSRIQIDWYAPQMPNAAAQHKQWHINDIVKSNEPSLKFRLALYYFTAASICSWLSKGSGKST